MGAARRYDRKLKIIIDKTCATNAGFLTIKRLFTDINTALLTSLVLLDNLRNENFGNFIQIILP